MLPTDEMKLADLKKIFFAKGCELFSFEKFDFFNFSENF
jgi:hypothetical protein